MKQHQQWTYEEARAITDAQQIIVTLLRQVSGTAAFEILTHIFHHLVDRWMELHAEDLDQLKRQGP